MATQFICDNCGNVINGPYMTISSTGNVFVGMRIICYSICVATRGQEILDKEVIPRITNQQIETTFRWTSTY
jgi:hypothetical protein